jgi:hypothetical protein
VPQARDGRFQIGITAAMKPEQGDRLEARGVFTQPTQRFLKGLQPPEVVGELSNPALETVRRLWWRAFDRVCDWIEIMKLPIQDRIFGPEPPTSADLQREVNHERLVRAFPAAAEAIEPGNAIPCKSRRRSGSPYR